MLERMTLLRYRESRTTHAPVTCPGAAMAEKSNPATGTDRLAEIVEELRRQHDPRRSAAEQTEYAVLAEKYPGHFVAFVDTWDGQHLTREVIAASPTLAEFHLLLKASPEYEARRREITVTQTRDPEDDAIDVPLVFFDTDSQGD